MSGTKKQANKKYLVQKRKLDRKKDKYQIARRILFKSFYSKVIQVCIAKGVQKVVKDRQITEIFLLNYQVRSSI